MPTMYYVNVGFAWFFVMLSMGGYVYTLSKTGEKWAFWPLFAGGWTMFAVSHSLLVSGVSSNEWYMTLFRVLGYVLILVSLCPLLVRIRRPK